MASSGSGAAGGGAELPPAAPAICCMCGDHGLMQEMFQCKVCVVRSQHKYCSELYLKTESYRACNWCLRDSNNNEGSTKLNNLLPIRDAKKSSPSTSSSSSIPATATAAASSAGAVKIHREAFPTQLNNKPVKKLRVLQPLDPSASSDAGDRMRSEQELLKGRQKQQQQAGKAKVRRYKLLEEVSS